MKPTLVFLSGFGFYSSMWDACTSELSSHFDCLSYDFIVDLIATDNEELIDTLVATLPSTFYLCGWSLGGQLALAIAARYPERVSGMVLLATAPTFTDKQTHLPSMPEQMFAQFKARFVTQPLTTWRRFIALQSLGHATPKLLTDEIAKHLIVKPSICLWMQAFERLAALSMWESLNGLAMPTAFIYFSNDKLVSACWHDKVSKLNHSMIESYLVPDAAHASVFQQSAHISSLFKERLL